MGEPEQTTHGCGHAKQYRPTELNHLAARRTAVLSNYNIMVPLKGEKQLAYNSLTGSFALLEQDDLTTMGRIAAGELKIGDEEALPFYKMGYAVPEGTDEFTELELRYNAYRNDPSSMVLTIAPTLGCNFACGYCFQGLDKPFDSMPQDVQDALVAFVAEEAKYFRHLGITWYGGEPLLCMDAIRSMTAKFQKICAEKGRRYTGFIVTNGFRLNQKMAEELISLGVTEAQVTFDGAEHVHDEKRPLVSGKGTFKTLLDNLEGVVKNTTMKINIRVNVDQGNRDGIKDLIDQLAERGLGARNNLGMYFAPIEGITDACQSADDQAMSKTDYGVFEAQITAYAIERQLTGLPKPPSMMGVCVAARPRGVVAVPNGDLHKCWDTVMIPDMRIGTVFEPEKLDDDATHRRWLEWSPFANDTCSKCKIIPNCAGMCAYKFVHDTTHGESGTLPCPSWKFNIAERLFLRAQKLGMVEEQDWDPEESPTRPDMVGKNHDFDSIDRARKLYGAVDVPDPLPPMAIRC